MNDRSFTLKRNAREAFTSVKISLAKKRGMVYYEIISGN
jgi:hypothetical protein